MKIAHIVRRYARNEWGGTETVVSHIATEQLRRGDDVRIFFTSACQPPGSTEGYAYYYPYWPMPESDRIALDKKGGSPISPALMRAVEDFKPDLIHIHAGGRLACAAAGLAEELCVPSVMSLHGGAMAVPESEMEEMLRPMKRKIPYGGIIDRLMGLNFDPLEQVDAIICISYAEKRKLAEKYGAGRVHYLPNGVEPPAEVIGRGNARSRASLADPRAVKNILCVSRIDYQKNQLALVELLAGLPSARLTLVGPVTAKWYGDKILARVRELALEDRFTMIPGLPPGSAELEAEYAKADVFVLPSIHEPFGIVALEAMQRGIPLVASAVGGLVDFVHDGKNGLLFDPAAPDSLKYAFSRFVMDEALAARIAEGGRRTASGFMWPAIVDRLEGIYRETVLGVKTEGFVKRVTGGRDVSILVRSRNEARYLERTLAGIEAQHSTRILEVIVCDDASTDDSLYVVEAAKTRAARSGRYMIRTIPPPDGEYRPGRMLNAMVKAASGRVIVFNNADAVPLDCDWLENLIAPLDCGRADVVFANQLPRPDADVLVKKDSVRAFGNGLVSADWPHFFSLASSAAMKYDLQKYPFDETLIYSEDVEWANRRKGFRRVYSPLSRVEHSHDYTNDQLVRRFYGEGYADAQIFGDRPAPFAKTFLRVLAESLRDARYVMDGSASVGFWKGLCTMLSSPRRRWLQRMSHERGVADFREGRPPRYVSTSVRQRQAACGKTPTVLFTGVYPKYHGGLERFAARMADLLRSRGYKVDVMGDPPEDASGYSYVLMHKVPPSPAALRRLKSQCGGRLHFFAHDHELYCLRRHGYTPFRCNCTRAYSPARCRLCAMVTRPRWIWRALTRPMRAFFAEMKGVRIFAPSAFTRDALLRNGFNADDISIVAPFFHEGEIGSSRVDLGSTLKDPKLTLKDPKKTLKDPNSTLKGPKPLNLLFMGQLIAGKGVDILLDAVNLLDIPFRLTVVGSGRDEAKLRAKAASFASEKRDSIVFTGWCENPEAYFAEADAVVFPSRWNEPYGLTGVEGYCRGVPCVGFATGGVPGWLIDGETGVLVGEKTPEALAAGIVRIADPAYRLRLAKGALRFAHENFAPDVILRRMGFQSCSACEGKGAPS